MARPTSATAPPINRERRSGLARTMKSPAQTKPSGTRQRCTHVPPLRATGTHLDHPGCSFGPPQSFTHRRRDFVHADLHADPLRARAPVAVHAAVDVRALDADVVL